LDKKLVFIVAAFMSVVPAVALAAPAAAEDTLPAWTVMVYMDGDNDLEASALADLAEMAAAGSDEDVNIVVLLDTLSGPADLLYVAEGSTQTVAEWGEVPMDDGANLVRFITTVEALYPSEKTALVMYDHGGGLFGLCWDDTTGADECIRLLELADALDQAGADLDLLVFNACLMGQAEIAFQVAHHADTVVFSEQIMSMRGFEWHLALDALRAEPTMDGTALGLLLGANYAANNAAATGSLFTVSVLDTSAMDAVVGAFAAAAAAQTAAMDEYASQLRECRNTAEEADPYGPVDVVEYMSNVAACARIDDLTVRSTAQQVVDAVEEAVLYHWALQWVEGMNGLGVYFPRNNTQEEWTVDGEVYSALPFCQETGWDAFLAAYDAA